MPRSKRWRRLVTSFPHSALLVLWQDLSAKIEACEARLQHRVDDWRMFLAEPNRSQRAVLLNILAVLPLRSVNDQHALISAVTWIIELRSLRDDWVALDIDDRFLGRNWSPSACHPTEAWVYSRHGLECAVLFEVMAGFRAGDLYVEGAAHIGNYHAELFDGQLAGNGESLKPSSIPTSGHPGHDISALRRVSPFKWMIQRCATS